jgi:sugar lactone lactonase YvrE
VGRMVQLGSNFLWGITVSNQDLFWINVGLGIQKAPLAGGTITTLAPGFVSSDGLAVDDRGVYWYVLDSADSVVMQVPRDGGDTAVLVSGLASPSGIGTDGAFVYVADTAGRDTDAPVGRLLRVNRDGGEPTILATEPVPFKRLALDDAFVYWTAGNTAQPGSVSRIARDGSGTRTVLAEGLTRAFDLAVDDRYVYWADRDGVRRLRKP